MCLWSAQSECLCVCVCACTGFVCGGCWVRGGVVCACRVCVGAYVVCMGVEVCVGVCVRAWGCIIIVCGSECVFGKKCEA